VQFCLRDSFRKLNFLRKTMDKMGRSEFK
jgi:hypothetical protein